MQAGVSYQAYEGVQSAGYINLLRTVEKPPYAGPDRCQTVLKMPNMRKIFSLSTEFPTVD
jgi:hypothetical protein